ncbi:MAG: flagellar protein FlbD [Chlamydiales bacterium]|jgi:flagellar protein FlbD|nr:flagellar protein FlbD [Chlamydiales bacterium]
MIKVTKFSGEEIWINPEQLKTLEKGGDTIVTLTSGERLLVKERVEEIVSAFIAYKQKIHQRLPQVVDEDLSA